MMAEHYYNCKELLKCCLVLYVLTGKENTQKRVYETDNNKKKAKHRNKKKQTA